jgi:hypothetical protein
MATNTVLRQFSTRAFVQKFVNYAHGLDQLDPMALKKLGRAGLDESNIDDVFEGLKKFVTRDGDGKIEHIDWEGWHAADGNSVDLFRLAIDREARRAVQEHTIGESAPWMHTTIGKMLTQFRTFMLVAHAKQTLYGLNHMDAQTATAWMLSTVMAGAAYTVQSGINYAHNPEMLEKRLNPVEIAKAAFARSGFSGLIPAGWDSTVGYVFGPTFSSSRTTGLANDLISGVPTVDLVSTKAFGTVTNTLKSLLTDDHTWTKQDVRNGLGLMIPNYLIARNLVDAASDEFPTFDPSRSSHK